MLFRSDRAVLMAVWTVYIFVGSVLKDRRLAGFLGGVYRDYQTRVPGYPGMSFGPLARLPRPVPIMQNAAGQARAPASVPVASPS